MEQTLHEYLRDGEQVLWTETPKFETLDKTHKGRYLLKAVVVCAVMLACVAFYLSYLASSGVEFKIAVPVILVILMVMMLSPDLADARKLRKTIYAATDSRLLVLMDADLQSVEYWQIKEYDFAEDADGNVSLLCGGEAVEGKQWNRRLHTVLGPRFNGDKTVCERFAMYAIPEQEAVRKLMKQYVK